MRARRIACLAFLAGAARAQIPPLEPDSTASGVVLQRADWERFEPLDLAALLRGVAATAITVRGGLGSVELANLAGSTGGRVRLFVDGVEIGEPELAWPRLAAEPVGFLTRVEIDRAADPVCVRLWTRDPAGPVPRVDFDLGRGGFATRTRRVTFATPRGRGLGVTLDYDELLRDFEDFRVAPGLDAEPDLGEHDARALRVRLDVRRPGDESVRWQHQRQDGNAHGSGGAQDERVHVHATRDALRWRRPLGAVRMVLDLGHQAAYHDDRRDASNTARTEARTTAGLDLGLPARAGWKLDLRARAAVLDVDRADAGGAARFDADREELGFEAGRPAGRFATALHAGVHRDGARGTAWSAGGRAALGRGAWRVEARGGRGVSFAGAARPADDSPRAGLHAALRGARTGRRVAAGIEAFAKRMDGAAPEVGVWFPAAGSGPERVAGLVADATLRAGTTTREVEIAASGAWLPEVRGPRAGLPRWQGRIAAHATQSAFAGDLVVSGLAAWRFDAARGLGDTTEFGATALGDLTLELRFLQRAAFFWSVRNVLDARVEQSPGVLETERTSLLGLRLSWFD